MIEHNLESSNSYIVVKAGNDGKLVRRASSSFFKDQRGPDCVDKEDPLHFFFLLLIPSRVFSARK